MISTWMSVYMPVITWSGYAWSNHRGTLYNHVHVGVRPVSKVSTLLGIELFRTFWYDIFDLCKIFDEFFDVFRDVNFLPARAWWSFYDFLRTVIVFLSPVFQNHSFCHLSFLEDSPALFPIWYFCCLQVFKQSRRFLNLICLFDW